MAEPATPEAPVDGAGHRLTRATAVLRDGLRDLGRLVVPVQCPGCGVWDEPVCAPCAEAVDGVVRRCEPDVPRLDRMDGTAPMPVWAAAAYTGPVRGVVVAWKDRGRVDLTARMVAVARRLGRETAAALGEAAEGDVVHVVPVPSTRAARRRRGADLVALLAAGVTAGLVEEGTRARTSPVLARRPGGQDQVGLGARARELNTAGSWRLRSSRRGTGHDGAPCLLVDDVVTTGATLAGCERLLSASGGLVLGAVALAATPAPTRGPGAFLTGVQQD